MINSFENAVNCTFTNQNSTDFLDLLDTDFIQINNKNDINCTREDNYEQEQQIASSPTIEYDSLISTAIYHTETNENINKNNKFNPRKEKTHTFWPRENMYVIDNDSFFETNNNDLSRTIKMFKKGGLFNPEQIQVMDTGTKETEINKSNEMISLFEGSGENMNENKLSDFEDFLFNINDTNVNSFENSNGNAQTPLNSSIDGGELNFEKTGDLNEILNSNESNTKKQEVFNIKSSLMKRVENLNMKINVNKTEKMSRQDSMSLQFEDVQGLFTPTMQFVYHDPVVTNVCHDFLKSLPTPQINTSELFSMDFQTPQITESTATNKTYANEINPFLKSLSAAVELNEKPVKQQQTLNSIIFNDCNISLIQVQNQISIEAISLDHDYTTTPTSRKRKSSSLDDDSNFTFDYDETQTSEMSTKPQPAIPSKKPKPEITMTKATVQSKKPSLTGAVTSTNGGKRRRVKGIYRAGDVTSKEELDNYLERRRKNNISSKQSRLTKKNMYCSMDDKSNQLEKDNAGLKQTITHLENLTQLLKDVLLQRFTNTIK